jgi:hypothetical protein
MIEKVLLSLSSLSSTIYFVGNKLNTTENGGLEIRIIRGIGELVSFGRLGMGLMNGLCGNICAQQDWAGASSVYPSNTEIPNNGEEGTVGEAERNRLCLQELSLYRLGTLILNVYHMT